MKRLQMILQADRIVGHRHYQRRQDSAWWLRRHPLWEQSLQTNLPPLERRRQILLATRLVLRHSRHHIKVLRHNLHLGLLDHKALRKNYSDGKNVHELSSRNTTFPSTHRHGTYTRNLNHTLKGFTNLTAYGSGGHVTNARQLLATTRRASSAHIIVAEIVRETLQRGAKQRQPKLLPKLPTGPTLRTVKDRRVVVMNAKLYSRSA